MKRLITVIAFIGLTITTVLAQDSPYHQVMKKEIANLIQADSLAQFQQSANAFARIAEINGQEWQPLYYGALAYTYQGFNQTLTLNQKDAALASAEDLVNRADILSPQNAEIITLRGFVLMAQLSANPGDRGQTLSGAVMATYEKALALDGENPRALGLMAQMEFGMAQFFGNGVEKACRLAQKSAGLFAIQEEQSRKAAMMPTWGKSMTEQLLKRCK